MVVMEEEYTPAIAIARVEDSLSSTLLLLLDSYNNNAI